MKTFKCSFPSDFQNFIALIAKYRFPGDIYNVSTSKPNGNDTIVVVYDMEMALQSWNKKYEFRFYGIGNGDYFCLNRAECPNSTVYYYFADRGVFKNYCATFEEWVRQLPTFIIG